jgi:hypothetical protein
MVLEFEVFEDEDFLGGIDEVFFHEGFSKLCFVVPEFTLIEVELVDVRDVGWRELFSEDGCRVDASDPWMEEYFFEAFEATNSEFLVFME